MYREQIIQYASLIAGSTNKEDSELIAMLVQKGVAEEIAERIVAFLPIAFGRIVIEKLGNVIFADTFTIYETGQEMLLNQEAIYVEALQIARESYESGLIPRKHFSAIATRSAELGAVNKALNEGVDINGASLRSVVLWGFNTLGKR